MNEFERQPPMCREPRDFIRQRRRANPVLDNSAKELAVYFSERGTDRTHRDNREVVRRNGEWLGAYLDISEDLTFKGAHTALDQGIVVSKQDLYTTDVFVNAHTGEIWAMSLDHEEELELMTGERGNELVKLELEVCIDHPDFVRKRPGYQAHQFSIHAPENPQTGMPFEITMVVSPRAVENLIETMRACNDPTA